jgi:hypothetical protein
MQEHGWFKEDVSPSLEQGLAIQELLKRLKRRR